jgi:hypothetical protein
MKAGAPRWVALALVGLLAVGAVYVYGARARPPLDELKAWGRAQGITIESRSVERGWFEDTLHNVAVALPKGAAAHATEVVLSSRPFSTPSLHVPELRLAFKGDPLEAFSQVAELEVPNGFALHVSRLSFDYRDRAVGSLALDGVIERSGAAPGALHVEALALGKLRWSDVDLAVRQKGKTLEVLLGADVAALPRAIGTYVPSDGRASEWRLAIPHQSLAALRGALGLGDPSPRAAARIGGTLSLITPDVEGSASRGSCRFVLDEWERPAWPEASALVGSSGALAAVLVPNADGTRLSLERVEVVAALFELRGTGTIAFDGTPKGTLVATGRRTCAELAADLPRSRHRDRVRKFLGLGAEESVSVPRDGRSTTWRGGESVELSLRVDLSFVAGSFLRFAWHLSSGCGLSEMTDNEGPAN